MSECIVRMPPDMPYEIRAELNAWYVESEPIVRCKDCSHYCPHGVPTCQRNRESFTGYDINGDYGEWYSGEFYVEPNGFCAWGKRKAVEHG